LDALRGCKRKVKTIHGDKEIQVKPQSRNRDEVIIPHCGVGGTGDQKVVLDVEYPKNTDKLIGVLLDEVV
jgi:DnaJ-class molecular chaperone